MKNKNKPDKFKYDYSSLDGKLDRHEMVTHKEVMTISRQNPKFVEAEIYHNPYFCVVYQLYEHMKRLDISIIDLSKRSGVSEKKLLKFLDGEFENLKFKTLSKIAESIGVIINIELLDLNNFPQEEIFDILDKKKGVDILE